MEQESKSWFSGIWVNPALLKGFCSYSDHGAIVTNGAIFALKYQVQKRILQSPRQSWHRFARLKDVTSGKCPYRPAAIHCFNFPNLVGPERILFNIFHPIIRSYHCLMWCYNPIKCDQDDMIISLTVVNCCTYVNSVISFPSMRQLDLSY